MPPQIRAFVTSYSRSLTRSKWRSPSPVTLGIVKSMSRVRRNLAITSPIEGVPHECALGYSGWFGVPGSSCSQFGSAIVPGREEHEAVLRRAPGLGLPHTRGHDRRARGGAGDPA